MCLYPNIIVNRKYVENKKNGGVVPAVHDKRVLYVPTGCGQCMECRKKKAREWQTRLFEDLKHNKNAHFITLTFSTESLRELTTEIPLKKTVRRPTASGEFQDKEIANTGYTLDNAICTLAVRRFCERHRKKYGKSIRHFLVSELGQERTEHVHLHGIVWTDEPLTEIEKIWQYGWCWKSKEELSVDEFGHMQTKKINYVNEQTVNYIVKYINKIDEKHKTYKPVVLTSPGIGRGYMERTDCKNNKFKGTETNEAYRTKSGHKTGLPIYYRNKIYTDNEREQLWLQRLDKGERWICGERVDIKTTEAEYYKLLKFYQEKNKDLGYGDNTTWKKSVYENERRQLVQKVRLEENSYPIEWDMPTEHKEVDSIKQRYERESQMSGGISIIPIDQVT